MFYSNKYPKSVFRELQDFPYSKRNRRSIFNATKASEDFVQRLKLLQKLPIHYGCVNCICWNEKGNKILSGSDDQYLIITDPFSYQVLAQYRTNHRANIFSAKFLPNTGDNGIVSCCGDGSILYTDLSRVEETQDCLFNCHSGTTYDVVTIPNDPNVFLSCGEDYTVRSFDLRVKNKCNKVKCKEDVIIQCRRAVTALTVNSLMPCQIAIGCGDSTARIYDRRMVDGVYSRLSPVDAFIRPGLEKKPYRITSLNFSPEGDDLLVSYSSEHVYLFGVRNSKETVYSCESLCGSDEEEGGMGVWCRSEKGDNVPVRRLRLRGDWSDTGPDARPHTNSPATASQGGRRVVQGGLIQRMTDVLSRMLNDPATRAALSQGGESEPSDQMQLEEGLGEYLDMNSRRRSDPANAGDGSTGGETENTVNEEGETEQAPVAMEHDSSVDEACMDVSTPLDISSDDSAQLSDINRLNVIQSPSQCLQNNIEVPRESSPSLVVNSEDLLTDDSVKNELVDSGEMNEDPCLSNPTQLSSSCRIEKLSDDCDEGSAPLKRAKEENSSPFVDNVTSSNLLTDCSKSLDDVTQRMESEDSSIPEPSVVQPSQDLSLQNEPSTSSDFQNVPSTSQTPEEGNEAAGQSNPNLCVLRSSDLTDELSTMFYGFKQKYGKKPMVNLVYSVRGSTASTISMTVEDQRNTPPNSLGASQDEIPDIRPEGGLEGNLEAEEEEAPVIRLTPIEETTEPPAPAPSTSAEPSTSSYSSTRFAVRMEKELCKAIRNARGDTHQDETVKLKKANIRMTYSGHRNARTMIKEATFWGSDYVMSGSDCGHVFIWTRDTGRLVMTLQADNHVVNCLQPHPTLPILATSGIDYDLKLWAPVAAEPYFDAAAAQELMNRNAIMLEETKDTITVPASFMIRMLACLNQLRRGGPRGIRRRRVLPQQ